MLWQAPEAEVFPLCSDNEISQIVWSPLAQGVLTGKYRPGEPPPVDSRAASADMNFAMPEIVSDAALAAVQQLIPIAEEAGINLPTMALAWILRRAEVASAITGASRPEQVRANAAASGITLSNATLAAVDVALGDVPVRGQTVAKFGGSEGVLHRM